MATFGGVLVVLVATYQARSETGAHRLHRRLCPTILSMDLLFADECWDCFDRQWACYSLAQRALIKTACYSWATFKSLLFRRE
jgi:hypothetical protein